VGKTVPKVLSAALNLRLRPYSGPSAQFFPVQTNQGGQITIFFLHDIALKAAFVFKLTFIWRVESSS